MSACIFCKIVDGSIPSFKLYEDENVMAFLDISQTTKGHTLVIPKAHSGNVLEIESEELDKALMAAVRTVAKKLKRVLKCDGFNIVSNIEEVAGQTVFHTHIHIIPRYGANDGFNQTYTQNDFDPVLLEQLQQQITEER